MDFFDVDVFTRAHFGALKEKGVAMLRSDLIALDSECAEEVRATVHDQYMAFNHACQGITELEGCMQQLKDMLSVSNALVLGLKELTTAAKQPSSLTPGGGAAAGHSPPGEQDAAAAASAGQSSPEDAMQRDTEALEELLDELEVSIAERRLQDASVTFQEAQMAVQAISQHIMRRFAGDMPAERPKSSGQLRARELALAETYPRIQEGQGLVQQLQAELEAKRKLMAGLLEQRIQDPTCSDAELRDAVAVYGGLMGGAAAARCMLGAYSGALKTQQMGLLKPYMSGTGGSSGDGVDYAGAAAQKLFGTLDIAFQEFRTSFASSPALASVFMAWAMQEVERCGSLLRRHALVAHASAGGLLASAQCCASVLAYSCSVEDKHGISLAPHLMRSLSPALESVLRNRLKRIADEVKQVVTEEVMDGRLALGEAGELPTSAALLLQEVDRMVEDVSFRELADPPLGRCLRQGVTDLFKLYTSTIARAIKKQRKSDASGGGGDPAACLRVARALAAPHLADATARHAALFGELASAPELSALLGELEAALQP